MSVDSPGLISHLLQLTAEPLSPSEMLQAVAGCDPFSFPIYVLLQTPVVYPGPSDAVHTGGDVEDHSTHGSCLIPRVCNGMQHGRGQMPPGDSLARGSAGVRHCSPAFYPLLAS